MTTRTLLLPTVDFQPTSRTRDAVLVLLASLAIAAAAQIRLPLPHTPVPVTGQTLAVGLGGILLGSRRGAAAVVLYLLEGAMGLPFFSGAAHGVGVLTGVTAGYLIAMPFGAAVAGWMAENGWDRSVMGAFLTMQACSLIVMAGGTLWLNAIFHDMDKAVRLGFAPFIAGDVMKAAVAAVVLPGIWALRGASRERPAR